MRGGRTLLGAAVGVALGCAVARPAPPPDLRGRAALLLVAGPAADSLQRSLQAGTPAVAWADLAALRRTLRRNPGLAPAPEELPPPPPPLPRESRLPDPWAAVVRRYSAVLDVRWVVWVQPVAPSGWALRVLDARTGAVLHTARGPDPAALLAAVAAP